MAKSKIVTTENEVAPAPKSVKATRTVAEQIKYEWDNGAYSPLQMALKHNVEVEEVYKAIEQPEMLGVAIAGDQVDSAGPGVPISSGTVQKVHYTKN